MAYKQILYHLVFRTKYSENTINQDYSQELYNYIWGIIKNKNCHLFRINGTENHIHVLSDLHPSVSLSNFIKDIKVASNKWMKMSGNFPNFKGWASQYCAITYSYKERDTIIEYIKNQQEHHKVISFKDEMENLFLEQHVGVDTKWFWKG